MPQLDSPASIRCALGFAAAASIVILIYASLIPFDYTRLSWRQSWQRWREIPWLHLELYNRADWIANALVVLPSGFLAAAAVDWGRTQRWRLLVAVPVISVLLAGVVVGIELAQVWFPTRTVSLNDIVAGYVGAVLGPLIWVVAGREVELAVTRFLTLPKFADRLVWLCLAFLALVAVYSVLPLDFVVRRSEWQLRLAEDSIRLNPLRGPDAALHALKGTILGALRMGPVGVLLALTSRRRLTALGLLLLPVLLELVQVPIFSKHVSTMEIAGGWLGGAFGYVIGRNLKRIEPLFHHSPLWGIAWLLTLVGTCTALLVRHDQILRDPGQIAERFSNAWALPLVKYYSGTEYNALTNMLVKLGLFGVLGATTYGWQKTATPKARRIILPFTALTVGLAAPAIELLQVYLPPLVPDVSDVLTYWLGYVAGYQLLRLLWSPASQDSQVAVRAAR